MNAQYFIDKFTAIPDSQWTTRILQNSSGQCCALGHCGVRNFGPVETDESSALRKLFDCLFVSPVKVNDQPMGRFQETTPKARILAALEYIKTL